MTHVVWIDTESDGVRPDRRTWEVSMIYRRPGEDDTEMTIIITDSGVTGAEEPYALTVNRYAERFDRELGYGELRMTGARAAAIIHAATRDAYLVGAQVQFDAHSLTRLLQWYGFEPAWKRRLRDIESMVEGHLGQFGIGGLQDCARALGIPVDPTVLHTSLGDARLVRECFDMIYPKEIGS